MAPIHHHFELKKVEQSQDHVRFWIIRIILRLSSITPNKIKNEYRH
jgi:UDP-N-acetylmuramyl pentapeptide phosphotransferase/UDP-N-acetylglucosamine-1-phosphate transferase